MARLQENKEISIQGGELIAWQCTPVPPLLKGGTVEREWMHRGNQKFAYRCLPMVIANQMGWDVINPVTFAATWNGGEGPTDVVISWPTAKTSNLPQAHFGSGILTFTLGHLFQTPPGVNLWVKGPPNLPKDGIQALEGVVETDWNPATFTMNWIFTRPNHPVYFEAKEPICRVIPIPRYMTEVLKPRIDLLQNNQELLQKHERWRETRDHFNSGLKDPHSDAARLKWQKDYFKGGGTSSIWSSFEKHQTKIEQLEFEDNRSDADKQNDQAPGVDVRPIELKTPSGRAISVFISNLEAPNDTFKKRVDIITAMQSRDAEKHSGSSPPVTPTNSSSSGDGAN